ncbi:radical SAM protein [Kitasatospora sp. NPDC001540]|uniref:radical SAM protein n=1 Tax=Kitasatospora sp. NPDC001540 TaxID=3364014 RepID=UPI00367FE947
MRIIEGKSGVWHLGPGGTVLLPHRYYRGGRLTEEGARELEQADIAQGAPTDRYNLTVVTSTACNLGCPYCFQNTDAAQPGRFDPPRIDKQVLDGPTIDRIVEFTRPRMERAAVRRLFVLLFGGEPLLNPWACRELLLRLAALGPVTASMVSNGVLLTPRKAERLEEVGLRSVQITLDGPKELHDSLRATRAGRGTYESILDNITAVQAATRLRFGLRLNTTAEGLPHLEGLVRSLAERVDPSRCTLDIAPVLNYAGMFDGVLDRSGGEVETILGAYTAALEAGFTVGWPGGGSCGFCGERDGASGAVINADGTLYSCWETIGKPGYEVGDIDGGYRSYPQDRWVSCGEFAERSTTRAASQAFEDALSVGLLELLRAHKRRAEAVTAG